MYLAPADAKVHIGGEELSVDSSGVILIKKGDMDRDVIQPLPKTALFLSAT